MLSVKIILTWIIFYLSECYARTEWIDPFSMDDPLDTFLSNQRCEECAHNELVTSHFKRFINVYLDSLQYDEVNKVYKNKIESNLNIEDYNFLKNFMVNLEGDTFEWNRLDGIISNAYSKSNLENYKEMALTFLEECKFLLFSYESFIFLVVTIGFFFIYKISRGDFSLWGLFKNLLIVMYVVDFIIVWIRLIKEKEAEQFSQFIKNKSGVPRECDPSSMSFFDHIKSLFAGRTDACEEFFKMQQINIFWSVGIGQVLGKQFGIFIEGPSQAMGNAFGNFTFGIINSIPWYVMPLLPLIFIFILFAICIILSFLTSTSIDINLFYLFKFSFGKEDRIKMLEKTDCNFHKMLDVVNNCLLSVQENKNNSKNGADVEDITPKKLSLLKNNKSPNKSQKNEEKKAIMPQPSNSEEFIVLDSSDEKQKETEEVSIKKVDKKDKSKQTDGQKEIKKKKTDKKEN